MVDTVGDTEPVLRLLKEPEFEVMPLPSAADQLEFLPEGVVVTVTASPSRGIEPTLELAGELARRGFAVVPHLAARSIANRGHLSDVLESLVAAAIDRIFVIAGDGAETGEFRDGLSLIRGIEALGYRLPEIGVPAYPDGHPFVPDVEILQALLDKQPYASYMTTQMCFDPGIISRWITDVRSRGITLPIHLGIPGVAKLRKLMQISARIGVGESARFLSRHTGLLGNLTRRASYSPDHLVTGLSDVIADPSSKVEAFHFYTFNQVATTEAWRRDRLAVLGI